jgi:hypothetical protein
MLNGKLRLHSWSVYELLATPTIWLGYLHPHALILLEVTTHFADAANSTLTLGPETFLHGEPLVSKFTLITIGTLELCAEHKTTEAELALGCGSIFLGGGDLVRCQTLPHVTKGRRYGPLEASGASGTASLCDSARAMFVFERL